MQYLATDVIAIAYTKLKNNFKANRNSEADSTFDQWRYVNSGPRRCNTSVITDYLTLETPVVSIHTVQFNINSAFLPNDVLACFEGT